MSKTGKFQLTPLVIDASKTFIYFSVFQSSFLCWIQISPLLFPSASVFYIFWVNIRLSLKLFFMKWKAQDAIFSSDFLTFALYRVRALPIIKKINCRFFIWYKCLLILRRSCYVRIIFFIVERRMTNLGPTGCFWNLFSFKMTTFQ